MSTSNPPSLIAPAAPPGAATAFASQGGRARAASLTPERRREIARAAVEARWVREGKPPIARATHAGVLRIGDLELDCAVLDTGDRVLSQRGVAAALGISIGGPLARSRLTDAGDVLPLFVAYNNLKPFIDNDLVVLLTNPVRYLHGQGGGYAFGLRAELIPRVCDVWLKARDAGVLRGSQLRVATKADTIMRGLAQVGIIALVDEATGYQADRARDALAKILEAFIAKELRPWVRTFQPEFYQELFRLKGIEFNGTLKAPRYIGNVTNDLVYRRLAPGVVDELNRINPRNEKGQRKHKHFQWLTEHVGYQKLLQHLAAVTALMKVFDDFETFKKAVDKALPVQDAAPLFEQARAGKRELAVATA